MEKLQIPFPKSYSGFGTNPDPQPDRSIRIGGLIQKSAGRVVVPRIRIQAPRPIQRQVSGGNPGEVLSAAIEMEEEEEEEDELCPVECVREFKTDEELLKVIEKSKATGALVVVDFYRTSCGSCKYIEQGFSKLCKGSGEEGSPVIFLKHNVIDEYDEESEVADRLRIRAVPLFHFYKDGVLVEAFPTRDKQRITEAILKYTSSSSPSAQET
ncbi:unnamed protein product [Linum trigynum]|uniref:Thioredoxin domain-containing protein n=1 Tax=Linum trigynum TaxID=586398 RepID=A0AAV2GJB9_9ROSI